MKRIILLVCLIVFGSAALAQHTVVKYISTREARQQYANKIKQEAFLLFPDHREAPIQWFDSLKLKWLDAGYDAGNLSLQAQPGEYAVFQTGIWAIREDLKNIRVIFSDLKSKAGKQIGSGEVTCFNTGGINYQGHPFGQKVNVPSGALQALWMGIRIPETAKGEYSGQMTIQAAVAAKTGTLQTASKKINIRLTVSGELIADHGFDEGSRLSRMAWLNATDGMDGRVPNGFLPVSRKNQELHISGRSLQIGGDGLPEKITTFFTPSNQSLSAQGEPLL
ncbi:MAG TPA: glycoside hydrolase domain-containing protein, partial [Puia sp.]|nr:glycoside hydrolase domain-containing protein [Puia sp.]